MNLHHLNDAIATYGLTGTDQEVATALNTNTTATVVDVAPGNKRLWAAGEVLYKIRDGISNAGTSALKGLCMAADEFYKSDEPYSRATHKALLDNLVAGGILTQAEADALDGQADTTMTLAAKEALGYVREGDVTQARSL